MPPDPAILSLKIFFNNHIFYRLTTPENPQKKQVERGCKGKKYWSLSPKKFR